MGIKQLIATGIRRLFLASGLPEDLSAGLRQLEVRLDALDETIISGWHAVKEHQSLIQTELEVQLKEVRTKQFQIRQDMARDRRTAGAYVDKGTQILMAIKYRELADKGQTLPFSEVEFRNYSQTGEDGILWYIFSLIGISNKTMVEMCAGVGYECNSANLIVNHDWRGILFDGDCNNIQKGRMFFNSHPDTRAMPPSMVEAWITKENVNELIAATGVNGEIDLFSLDVDGIDYWILEALEVITPRVIILEFQGAWTSERAVTVPYASDFVAEWHFYGEDSSHPVQYGGASLPAFVKLAKKKGYRLVGSNGRGYNAFFVRDGIADELLPEVGAAQCFTNPVAEWGNALARKKLEEFEWQEV